MRVLNLLAAILLATCPVGAGGLPKPSERNEPTVTDWHWQGSLYNDDTRVVPPSPEKYTLTLKNDGAVHVRADCNQAGGGYTLEGSALQVHITHSTMAMCEPDSLDGAYLKDLSAVQSWMLHDGDLVLMLKYDTGTMRFSKEAR